MEKWARAKYWPCLPLGADGRRVTGSPEHIQISLEAAREGAVLLKNEDNILPLKIGTRVAVFGKAQIDYVKGGGGSGDVHCEYVRNIYEGLQLKEDKVEVFSPLSDYYANYVKEMLADKKQSGMFDEAEIPADLLADAKSFADTAIITVNRYSGEGWDRHADDSDSYFNLSKLEKDMVYTVCNSFENVIVLLNTGAMIDTSWFADNKKIKAALMIWQGGMEGGLACADILVGDVNPSGKLVDTCAIDCYDYPSTEGFHESEDYVKYTEDIFVGYRYFETVPGKKERVVYPFGYGLSYTTFEITDTVANEQDGKINISVTVKNTGTLAGKEVVQVYFSAPSVKITKPSLVLSAFAKTRSLAPTEAQTLTVSFDVSDMASYDDTGAIQKSAYVMESGEYKLYIGSSVRDITEIDYKYTLKKDTVIKQLTEYCAPKRLGKRLLANGDYQAVENKDFDQKKFECTYKCEKKYPQSESDIKKLIDVYEGKVSIDEFLTQLTDEEIMQMLTGTPNAGVSETGGIGGLCKYGVPTMTTADGPAGARLKPQTGIRTTAFPIATMLACSWNTELVERVGAAGALEIKENNVSIWLTPALNIHRSPLCGRNFEYYSEDPFVAGKMAAAMVRGIQSQGIGATPKHFACNNKEVNRRNSDSVLSERALREIYLKGFEICIKESDPWLIMTSYNIINGVRSSENAELLRGILRGEWGYEGLIITDWLNTGNKRKEAVAGNDVRMPWHPDTIFSGVSRGIIAESARYVLRMILKID
ncbi:MAG: glycoside hydrolase family 3 C-terminal domain-containing protein [Clostridia bacterium]|nr:glycoside hydrolase family 3 C-terminal domain-containing protein [Clostridia bacterium]